MPDLAARAEQRRPGRHRHGLAVDRQLDRGRRLDRGRGRRPRRPGWRLEHDLREWLGCRRLVAVRRVRIRAGRGHAQAAGVVAHGRTLPRSACAHSATSSGWRSADSIADDAVWPRPQIEASRIAWPMSRSRTSSSSRERTVGPGREPRQQLLLADAPHPTRHALPARLVAEELRRSAAACRPGRRSRRRP